jgi:NhaA family Na+:H+ antiporter
LVVHRFVRTEASGGVVLVAATVVALVWANSPWRDSYTTLWHNRVSVQLGGFRLSEELGHFVNDGLMALFFFVVGLEIKRELVRGELADRRVAALPVCAAIGGMVAPAALYIAITAGAGRGGHGWGIPMATDIAFALGVLALLGSRAPNPLKLFLLTLAIVDDVGAILVIAVFYSGSLHAGALVVAALTLLAAVTLRRLRVDWPTLYVVLGVVTWYATYRSGVHATIAGVALGLTTPARPLAPAQTLRRWALDLADEPAASDVHQMMVVARESVSPAEHLENRLHPFTSFVVLPTFALANAGIVLHGDMLGTADAVAVAVGVSVALIGGKFVGILGGAWLSVRFGVAVLPEDIRWPHIAGAAALGGIGFTVSLFVSGLAFADLQLADAAKVAILGASLVSALIGAAVLVLAGTLPRFTKPRSP